MLLFSKHPKTFLAFSAVIAMGAFSACGGSSDSSQVKSETDSSTTVAAAVSPAVDAGQLAKVVCDDSPSRMDADAERYTQESWQCSYKGESVRIDIYKSADEQATANQVVSDFYKSSGDEKALADLPLLCGSNWGIGVDFNETRDALIASLSSNGFKSSTCD